MNIHLLKVFTFLSMAFMPSNPHKDRKVYEAKRKTQTKEELEEEIALAKRNELLRINEFQIRNKVRQGLSMFHYGGICIWALNQKNADRKARNAGVYVVGS